MNLIFSPANPYLTIFLLKEPWLHFRHYPAPIMAFFFFLQAVCEQKHRKPRHQHSNESANPDN